jgi:hypothetical protein
MNPKAQKILDHIRLGRENNIRTLNTIDTMIPDTMNTRTSDTNSISRPSAAVNGLATSSFSSGQKVIDDVVVLEENDSSQVCTAPSKIVYACASLKAPNGNRRTLNIDFRLNTSDSGKFNKVVFNLSDRHREFFNNIPDDWKVLPAYEQAWEYYHTLDVKKETKWIGKGRLRGRFQEGKTPDKKIKKSVTCVLEQTQLGYIAHIWIEKFHLDLELRASTNKQYPFKSEMIDDNSTMKYDDEGGWV